MSKYIDAEKLRKLLTNRYEEITVPVLTDEGGLESFYRRSEIHNILKIVDSLQQEQPDCHTVEDWIQHIKNADQLTKDIFSKGPYDVLYDALNHPYRHCYDAIKEFGELCFQTGANSVKQEQLSLPGNLDEEAEEWCKINNKGIALCGDKKSHYLAEGVDAFKAGAEWMAGK